MADESEEQLGEGAALASPSAEEGALEGQSGGESEEVLAAAEIGVERYVHAAFFGAAILAAYIGGQMFLSVWNILADMPDAVRQVPQLIEYTEEQRSSYCLIIGAVVGAAVVLSYYRRPAVRGWAFDVARELGRVTWPTRDTVTNGTIVVIIASVVATVYVTLLDRFWGYLTNLVYGA
jgi:preprotein translocase subunit SecE